ncbi:MAG TPA: MFS transporter [Candidatus Limnocylindria bacterium]|jgi:LPLT family lysophospholipid transporter-like MFS transporter|nr:MFS transporter [Candidatus Limnocylindria bacterium]
MNTRRNYPLLLASQFLSAFGDNAILAVILGQLTLLAKAGTIAQDELRTRGAIYTGLLFVPYVLLAPLAGFLNDRYAKTTWLTGGNLFKLAGTAICAISIWQGYVWQAPGYFIVGIGSCFYGPAKYGILPEILPRESLVKANGMVELLTLLAILFGGIGGSWMSDHLTVKACYIIVASIFGGSLALNALMTRTPSDTSIRLKVSVSEFIAHFGGLMTHARLGRMLVGTAIFWLCGATMKVNFQPWGLYVLKLNSNTEIAALGLWLAIGIMAGSIVAGIIHRVGDLRRTQLYGLVLAGTLLILWSVGPVPAWQSWTVMLGGFKLIPLVILLLIATGFVAGLFLIPLNAALQAESNPTKLGKTIAAQNFTDNIAMIVAAGICWTCVKLELSAGGVFIVLAAIVVLAMAFLRIPASVERSRDPESVGK